MNGAKTGIAFYKIFPRAGKKIARGIVFGYKQSTTVLIN